MRQWTGQTLKQDSYLDYINDFYFNHGNKVKKNSLIFLRKLSLKVTKVTFKSQIKYVRFIMFFDDCFCLY